MNAEARKRLTTLFYVLTRDQLPWGKLHKLIDDHALVGDGEHVYCSDAGRALAAAAVDRLLDVEDPWVDIGPGHSVRASQLAMLPSQTRPTEHIVTKNPVGITVDTSICPFDKALPHAIALAQTHVNVSFHHGIATVQVERDDTEATLRDRWQRETDRVRGQRARLQDARAPVVNDLRAAGFESAGWTYDDDVGAITMSCANARKLLNAHENR